MERSTIFNGKIHYKWAIFNSYFDITRGYFLMMASKSSLGGSPSSPADASGRWAPWASRASPPPSMPSTAPQLLARHARARWATSGGASHHRLGMARRRALEDVVILLDRSNSARRYWNMDCNGHKMYAVDMSKKICLDGCGMTESQTNDSRSRSKGKTQHVPSSDEPQKQRAWNSSFSTNMVFQCFSRRTVGV